VTKSSPGKRITKLNCLMMFIVSSSGVGEKRKKKGNVEIESRRRKMIVMEDGELNSSVVSSDRRRCLYENLRRWFGRRWEVGENECHANDCC
jgi:hypothetical protein